MPPRQDADASSELKAAILAELGTALQAAESDVATGKTCDYGLSKRFVAALEHLSAKCEAAATGYTNVITSIAIKAAAPNIDVRYHQVQIQDQTKRPANFNFRGVSEKVIYPWLSQHQFAGAKSGWQTRTFERPKPYLLSYDENIADIKEAFLVAYDELEEHEADPKAGLRHLFFRQVELREKKQIAIAVPKVSEISEIVGLFQQHFFHKYKGKGASRLPVLVFHAIYALLLSELKRFEGMTLSPLQEHSAADAQTGAVGDVEVVDGEGNVFEAVEIKHGIEIGAKVLEDVKLKLMEKSVNRYYVLTTHDNCRPAGLGKDLGQIRARYGCQVILNGVLPSLWYYLRLLADPSKVFPIYAELLKSDNAISHEHREAWNAIVNG